MTYDLAFLEVSLREWEKLDRNIQAQFKKKLGERLLGMAHVGSQS